MLHIKDIKELTLSYECDCGVIGKCMFKSPKEDSVLILDLQCPMCNDTERLKILKYSDEETKKKLESDNAKMHWALVVDNIIEED